MPRACEEMSEMLLEMKLMRNDLKSMRAKVAWLPASWIAMAAKEGYEANAGAVAAGPIKDEEDAKLDFIAENNHLDEEYTLPFANKVGNATWVHSTFHNVTAMVGAGVLGLPNTMVYLGWTAGVIIQVASFVITLYTLWQMCALHQIKGKRFNRYHELGQYAFGQKLGLWLVIPCQLIVMIGLDIVYCVTGGKSMQYVYQQTCGTDCASFGLSAWIVVFASISMVLSQIPNFHKLSIISLLAAVMSIGYVTIAIGVASHRGKQPGTVYNLDGFSRVDSIFGIFNSLGTVAFAYGGHNVIMEIQSTIRAPANSTSENPTLKPMMFGVYIAYALVAYSYFGVAFSGYAAFGSATGSQIIYNLGHPIWVVCTASIMIVVHVLGSFQVYAMPVYDMIEYQLVRRKIPNGYITRLIYRTLYVVLVAFVGITIPFFGDLLGFIGALGFGPTTFIYPGWMWLLVKKPSYKSWHFWASHFCSMYGIVFTILGAIGGMRGIIVDASGYSFYQ
jgi:amino acid permease